MKYLYNTGNMNRVSVYNFRDRLASYIETVVKTDTPLIIERWGKPVVKLVPCKGEEKPDYRKYFGFLKGEEDGGKFLKRVRRSKKESAQTQLLRKR